MKVKIDSHRNYDLNFPEAPKDIVKAFQIAMFEQRESINSNGSLYRQETKIYQCIKSGNLEELRNVTKALIEQEQFIGKLSKDALRQAQYTVIAGITSITRSAIEGGLSELEAYNLSDVYIQKMDTMTDTEEILSLYFIAACDFTKRVRDVKMRRKSYSYPIVLCIEYINTHLHYPITLNELSAECKLSPQYLSSLFKKETGKTVTDYIMEEKLETAKQMLAYSDYTLSEIAIYLSFCSHSNFTEHFHREYGITPKAYRDSAKTYQLKP